MLIESRPQRSRRSAARRVRWAMGAIAAVMIAGCAGTPVSGSATTASHDVTTSATLTQSNAVTVPPLPTTSASSTSSSSTSTSTSAQATSTAPISTEDPASTSTDPSTDTPAATTPPTTVTVPSSSPAGGAGITVTAADRAAAAARVGAMSTADKAASVIMVTADNVFASHGLAKQHYGGVILFAPGGVVNGTRSGTPSQVAAVTARLRADAAEDPAGAAPLIATDQEYGLVQRLKNGFTTFPRAAELGAIPNLATGAELTRQVAAAAAQEMRAVGVTVDFAPVFGVLPDDGSPSSIGQYGRSYGRDPQRVAALVAAAVTGYQDGGVVAGLKHFPGLARIAEDSHVTLPSLKVTCADWNAHEAVSARAGVDAGALMVMSGHMLLPAASKSGLPASIDPAIIGKLLRGSGVNGCDGMGFTGVTVTDSMQMEPITGKFKSGNAAVAALKAGEDLLLMPAAPAEAAAGIVAAVKAGTLSAARLDEAATAVLALRIASDRVVTPPLDVVNSAAQQALAKKAFAAGK